MVLFYFRDGANFASVYTQSKIVSENIKWNLNLKNKRIKCTSRLTQEMLMLLQEKKAIKV